MYSTTNPRGPQDPAQNLKPSEFKHTHVIWYSIAFLEGNLQIPNMNAGLSLAQKALIGGNLHGKPSKKMNISTRSLRCKSQTTPRNAQTRNISGLQDVIIDYKVGVSLNDNP